jgi:hypothetical protein
LPFSVLSLPFKKKLKIKKLKNHWNLNLLVLHLDENFQTVVEYFKSKKKKTKQNKKKPDFLGFFGNFLLFVGAC